MCWTPRQISPPQQLTCSCEGSGQVFGVHDDHDDPLLEHAQLGALAQRVRYRQLDQMVVAEPVIYCDGVLHMLTTAFAKHFADSTEQSGFVQVTIAGMRDYMKCFASLRWTFWTVSTYMLDSIEAIIGANLGAYILDVGLLAGGVVELELVDLHLLHWQRVLLARHHHVAQHVLQHSAQHNSISGRGCWTPMTSHDSTVKLALCTISRV